MYYESIYPFLKTLLKVRSLFHWLHSYFISQWCRIKNAIFLSLKINNCATPSQQHLVACHVAISWLIFALYCLVSEFVLHLDKTMESDSFIGIEMAQTKTPIPANAFSSFLWLAVRKPQLIGSKRHLVTIWFEIPKRYISMEPLNKTKK